MRIAVTGATGFLGSHVARRLVAEGHEVVGLRRPESSVRALEGVDLDWVVGDVTDPRSVARLVDGSDAVVHAAAVVQSDSPTHQRTVNVEGTRNVSQACEQAGARLVHVSSVAALRTEGDRPTEYHRSKAQAERVVAQRVGTGLVAVIVRPAWMLGPHHDGYRGSAIVEKIRRRPVVPYFRGGTSLAHVEDVVSGILGALRSGRSSASYTLAGENLSWRQIAEITAEVLEVRRLFVPIPAMVTAVAGAVGDGVVKWTGLSMPITRDVHHGASRAFYFDSDEARRELGYRFRPYSAIAQECVSWRAQRFESDFGNEI